MGNATEIVVNRESRDGWSVYTCSELPGLYVAGREDKIAYEDLPRAIEMLFKLDYGVRIRVLHKLSYESFVGTLSLSMRAQQAVSDRTAALIKGGASSLKFVLESVETTIPHDG